MNLSTTKPFVNIRGNPHKVHTDKCTYLYAVVTVKRVKFFNIAELPRTKLRKKCSLFNNNIRKKIIFKSQKLFILRLFICKN